MNRSIAEFLGTGHNGTIRSFHPALKASMPIDTACPHCEKKYRLKDGLAGKRATCSNPDCRQRFTVPESAVKKIADDRSQFEAEALAASMFSDDPNAGLGAAAEQQVDVICATCDHKWTEPASKIGKNVMCPECQSRQKIPERKIKKADWRDPNSDKPGGARGPELPDDLKAQRTTQAQFESLKQAGAIADDVEPMPLMAKLKWGFFAAAALVAVSLGVLFYFNGRRDGKENLYMAEALKELTEYKDDGPMAKGQPALCRALLLISAGEYSARSDSKEKLKEALGQFNSARDELTKAPKSPERDLLVGELALALLTLGGDEDQVLREVKIRWSPQDQQASRSPIGGDMGYVQQQLHRVLSILKNDARADDLDLRLWIARRLSRELTKAGKSDLLQEILSQAFADTEFPEARAQVALEALNAGATPAQVQSIAEELKTTTGAITAQVLWQKLGTPGAPTIVGAPGPGEITRNARLVAVSTHRGPEALAVAVRPGLLDDRLLALATIAEQSPDSMEAVDATLEILSKERAAFGRTSPQYALFRIARNAARAGQMDKVEVLCNLLSEDGLRTWAKADALRLKLAANPKQKAELSQVERPDDPAKLRVSAALTALAVTRHIAAQSGDRAPAKEYESWGKGNLRAFGLAGLALGLQDSKR